MKKNCDNCENCIYIGDGEYACIATPPTAYIVKENHRPAEDYCICRGQKWEARNGSD